MKCDKCGGDFEEKYIDESHDVPTYIFQGERKVRKQKADKYGRHLLCKKCHDIYEKMVFSIMVKQTDYETKQKMIKSAQRFAQVYFKKDDGDHTGPI